MLESSITAQRADRESRWQALMAAAQDGDRKAYSTLLYEMLPLLRGIVRKRWGSGPDCEDIVQEVLLSVHSVRHTYDARRPFMPWLLTITSRRIADAGRRYSARAANETTVEVFPETFDGHDAKRDQDVSDDIDELKAVLHDLSEGQREAIILMKIEGLTLEEASKRTGKSVAALKVTVHRAMQAMRAKIGKKT
ncbi:MAG: sigma-70 family RNA polymerase sigma factor [Alphaproteobacteria bacterium]|nr:sigma-70 family RNA polymerase sigma factor [Alphaproteobacteria bacterium]